jgi:redox-sensitive bicupin YhaK (pirin superfamily)
MFYLAAELEPGAVLKLPAEHAERGVHLVQGNVLIDGAPLPERHLAFVSNDKTMEVQAKSPSRVMLLGGDKMAQRRFIWWNFVASSRERIEAAKQRWREQLFPAVPGEREFIPLPEH